MRSGVLSFLALASTALLVAGCYQVITIDEPETAPLPWDAGPGARPDAGPGFAPPTGTCVEASGVDLLLVVDNSNSMSEEQEALAAALPNLVTALVAPPDEDGDGEPDWLPVSNLRIGVVTTDMGTGGYPIPTCIRSDFGDDGILRTEGRSDLVGCESRYPSFFAYTAGSRPVEDLAFDVGCVAQAGTGGCGFEQPLEAMLKALSPSAPTRATGPNYRPPTFFGNTRGHGDRANAGFLRDDSLLAVLIVTDEDDCSALDPKLFDVHSPRYTSDLNLRCAEYTEALHPVSRYVEGLSALRAARPDLLALGLLTGIPPDLAEARTDADFEAILRDPRMRVRVDPALPSRVVPSCSAPSAWGEADPPVRLVNVARQFGASRVSVQSICEDDYRPAIASFARLFGKRACVRYDD